VTEADPILTVRVHRSTVEDALACLQVHRDDEAEPDRYRASYAAAYEELADALRETGGRRPVTEPLPHQCLACPHDPGALMEEPDLHGKPEDGDR
jgi:hypothetical protein